MVSVIILSYNTKALLKSCLTSLYRHIKSITFEVIVVDNASSDQSVEMVKNNFPKVRIIENKQNFGFSKGSNIGATKAKGKFLLFLNSDIELLNDNFDQAIERLEKDKTVGIIGGSLLNREGTQQRSFGNFYNLLNVAVMLFGGDKTEMLGRKVDAAKKVEWVSGAFFLIKKDLFDKINGLDEHFFMYVEDMELCYRIKKQGYMVIFDPDLKAIHSEQGSSSREFAIVQIYKGIVYFYKKHKTRPEYVVVKGLLTIKAIMSLIVGVSTRNNTLISTYRKALTV